MAKLKAHAENETATAFRPDKSAPPPPEFMRRVLESCANWNLTNNKLRMEERRCAFDLQSSTLHHSKNRMKVLPPAATKVGRFPVAVLPGQFTDDFKRYTPDELCYLPLNTVRYGPVVGLGIGIRDQLLLKRKMSYSASSSGSGSSSSSSSDDEMDSVADADSEQNQIVLSNPAVKSIRNGGVP